VTNRACGGVLDREGQSVESEDASNFDFGDDEVVGWAGNLVESDGMSGFNSAEDDALYDKDPFVNSVKFSGFDLVEEAVFGNDFDGFEASIELSSILCSVRGSGFDEDVDFVESVEIPSLCLWFRDILGAGGFVD
jgi:hypothetical protein